MRNLLTIACLVLASAVFCAVSSTAQTVNTMSVYCPFGLVNGQSNRLTSITITPIQKTIIINGVLVTPPAITYSAATDHPELLTGLLTNAMLYPGVDYGMTNGLYGIPPPVINVTFKFTTNDAQPVNIALKLTTPPYSGTLPAYSTTASDARYSRTLEPGTNVVLYTDSTNGNIVVNATGGGVGSSYIFYNTNLPAGTLVTNGDYVAVGTNLTASATNAIVTLAPTNSTVPSVSADGQTGFIPTSITGNAATASTLTNNASTDMVGFAYKQSAASNSILELPRGGTTVNESRLSWFYNAMNPAVNTNAVGILITGDSTMNTIQGAVNSGLEVELDQIMKSGGGIGSYNYVLASSGVIENSNPDTNWYTVYLTMPPGESFTNIYWNGSAFVPTTNADTISVGAICAPDDASGNSRTNISIYTIPAYGGTPTLVAVLNAKSSARGFVGTNITVSGNVAVKVVSVGGTNQVLWASALISRQHTYQIYDFSYGGKQEYQWINVNTNIFIPAINFLHPSLVLFQSKNSTPATLTTYYPSFIGYWDAVSNLDQIHLGTYKTVNTGYDNAGFNAVIRPLCVASNKMYLDLYNNLPDTNTLEKLGWMYPDGIHLYPSAVYEGGFIWSEIRKQLGGINFSDTNYFQGENNVAIMAAQATANAALAANVTNIQRKLQMDFEFDEGFGNNVGDISGYNWGATNVLGTGWVNGKFGGGYKTTGQSDYVSVFPTQNAPLYFTTNGFTLSAWVKTPGVIDSSHYLQMFLKYSSGTNGQFIFLFTSPTALSADLNVISNGVIQNLYFSATIPSIQDTNWHYAALSYDNSNAYLFYDGVLK